MPNNPESQRLADFSNAVRESTLKRLRLVPPGKENWRVSPDAMSFADTARHLIQCDQKMLRKLKNKDRSTMKDNIVIEDLISRDEYDMILAELEDLGARRAEMLADMTEDRFSEELYDDRFGGMVTAWWIIVRGNLDHEIHHRGQIAAWLRTIQIAEM
jgi:uncharacterized damage-inducible protein DinB